MRFCIHLLDPNHLLHRRVERVQRFHGGHETGRLAVETCRLYHYRDKDQDEVDSIVEGEGGGVVGIEVKAAATVTADDFKGLRKLSAACGEVSKSVSFYKREEDTTMKSGKFDVTFMLTGRKWYREHPLAERHRLLSIVESE
jgi:hypothetical protein